MLQRYKVISLTVAAVFICYIDRVVISLAIIPMSEGMGWSETQRGFILSSFYIGYILTQIIGGLLSDRMGAKIVLGVGQSSGQSLPSSLHGLSMVDLLLLSLPG